MAYVKNFMQMCLVIFFDKFSQLRKEKLQRIKTVRLYCVNKLAGLLCTAMIAFMCEQMIMLIDQKIELQSQKFA